MTDLNRDIAKLKGWTYFGQEENAHIHPANRPWYEAERLLWHRAPPLYDSDPAESWGLLVELVEAGYRPEFDIFNGRYSVECHVNGYHEAVYCPTPGRAVAEAWLAVMGEGEPNADV